MSYQTIDFDLADGVAKLTLNRPDRLNSFTAQMHEEVAAALDIAAADQSARVLVLTGAGRGFAPARISPIARLRRANRPWISANPSNASMLR